MSGRSVLGEQLRITAVQAPLKASHCRTGGVKHINDYLLIVISLGIGVVGYGSRKGKGLSTGSDAGLNHVTLARFVGGARTPLSVGSTLRSQS